MMGQKRIKRCRNRRDREQMKKLSVLFLLIFLAAGICHPLFAKQKIAIDGIAYDRKHPDQSLVSIGGELYKKGDAYGDYMIEEVREFDVTMKDKKGVPANYILNGGNASAPAASGIAAPSVPGKPAAGQTSK